MTIFVKNIIYLKLVQKYFQVDTWIRIFSATNQIERSNKSIKNIFNSIFLQFKALLLRA